MSAKYVTFHDHAGWVVRDGPAFTAPLDSRFHAHRAAWLTSQLEASAFGTVQSYDGAGMSAGPMHWISVYPRDMTQGPLWKVLARIISSVPAAVAAPLVSRFEMKRWRLAEDGVLRWLAPGTAVSGEDIRIEFTGPHGKTPPSGPQYENAKQWALAYNAVFRNSATFQVQIDNAIRYLIQGHGDVELQVYRKYANLPSLDAVTAVPAHQLPPAIELAMCVYHAFTPNAPSEALRILRSVPLTLSAEAFSKRLIRGLGTSHYGRWHDDPQDKGSRYDATRRVVWNHPGLWDRALARSLMPKDL